MPSPQTPPVFKISPQERMNEIRRAISSEEGLRFALVMRPGASQEEMGKQLRAGLEHLQALEKRHYDIRVACLDAQGQKKIYGLLDREGTAGKLSEVADALAAAKSGVVTISAANEKSREEMRTLVGIWDINTDLFNIDEALGKFVERPDLMETRRLPALLADRPPSPPPPGKKLHSLASIMSGAPSTRDLRWVERVEPVAAAASQGQLLDYFIQKYEKTHPDGNHKQLVHGNGNINAGAVVLLVENHTKCDTVKLNKWRADKRAMTNPQIEAVATALELTPEESEKLAQAAQQLSNALGETTRGRKPRAPSQMSI